MASRLIFVWALVLAGTMGVLLPARAETQWAVTAENVDLADSLRRAREMEDNDPPAAYDAAHKALDVARRRGRRPDLLAALAQAARSARGVASYAEADALAAEGQALAAAGGDEYAAGEFCVIRGMVQWNLADLPAATASFIEAHRIAEKLDRDDLRIGAESGLGLIHARGRNHEESRKHLLAALRLAEKTGDPRVPMVLNYLGNDCLETKEYDCARKIFERALALANNGKNQRLVAYLLLNLGEIANETGDQTLAAKDLDDAMALSLRQNLPRGVADAHYLLARVERSRGHPAEAARHLDEGMELAAKLGNPDLLVSFYREFALTNEALGDYRAALDYSRKLTAKSDEIFGERNRRQMAELQARYEAETRNQQIKLLQRDADLQRTALELKKSELNHASARFYALVEVGVIVAIVAGIFIARQRSRVRRAARMVQEIRAAKEIVEASSAQKTRLLDVAVRDLTETEALFRDAFAHSPLGLALVSLEGAWLRVNAALCQVVGYSQEELLKTDFQSITHPDDLSIDLAHVEKLRRGEIETFHLDKRYIHRQGHCVWIRLDVSLHRDPATGEPRHFVSQVQDISERRRTEDQLRQAKEEAEAANAAKNDFLSRVSHELRTPLNAILGFGQLLELQDLGDSNNQGVSYVLTAGRHLLSLINEVLDLSSIESGKFTLSEEPTLVSELLSGTLELMRPLAGEAGIRLALEPGKRATIIQTDPRRLKQVLLNLLSNAIKYNRPDGQVTMRCHDAGDRLRIEVSDTGRGIAAADLEKAFAPFERLTATREVPGTGLGLSLSRALVEAMGGTLTAASEEGVGSTFTVEFPDVRRHESLPDLFRPIPTGVPALPRREEPGVRHPVLYIEDDRINLELLERLLALDRSLHLLTATEGARGIEIAREARPEVILLDVHLGDMEGADVMRALRDDPATADLPVIVVSADATGDQVERMLALGARRYLTKPINIEELRRTIDEYLHAPTAS